MCGKFTQMFSWAEVHAYSDLLGRPEDGGGTRGDTNDQEQTCTPMRDARSRDPAERGWGSAKS